MYVQRFTKAPVVTFVRKHVIVKMRIWFFDWQILMSVSGDFTDVAGNRHASTMMGLIVVSAGGVTKPLGALVMVSSVLGALTWSCSKFLVTSHVCLAICYIQSFFLSTIWLPFCTPHVRRIYFHYYFNVLISFFPFFITNRQKWMRDKRSTVPTILNLCQYWGIISLRMRKWTDIKKWQMRG